MFPYWLSQPSYGTGFNKLNLQGKRKIAMSVVLHAHALLPVLPASHPGVGGRGVVARFIVQFTVGTGSRVEVDVVARGLESQVHVLAGRRAVVDLVLEEGLVIVSRGIRKRLVGLVVFSAGLLWDWLC